MYNAYSVYIPRPYSEALHLPINPFTCYRKKCYNAPLSYHNFVVRCYCSFSNSNVQKNI